MTYTINSNSNITIQSSSPAGLSLNTNTILESSQLTYTPISASSKIIYDYSFLVHMDTPDSDICFIKLQEHDGSSWVDVSNCVKSLGNTKQLSQVASIKFIIDSWSGSKQLRLYCGAKGTSHDIMLYTNFYWYGAGTQYNKYKCILKVSEV